MQYQRVFVIKAAALAVLAATMLMADTRAGARPRRCCILSRAPTVLLLHWA